MMNLENIQNTKKNETQASKLILSSLAAIDFGQIEVVLPNQKVKVFTGSKSGPRARLNVHNLETFDYILDRSDVGLGEAYIKGYWTTQDVSSLIEFAVLNRDALKIAMMGVWHKILFYKLKHKLNHNSKSGSRKNIQAHYDLGNSFYKLWLDPSMTYSSAYWAGQDSLSLEQAQHNKYQLLLGQLNAKPGDHILEIGCGWGGFAEYAGSRGYRVTGVTISSEQLKFAQERIAKAGLAERVELLFKDYRDIDQKFDHVVSIEMLEAVGENYWPEYFSKVNEVVKPGGSVAIQSITIDDKVFNQYRKSTDFIQQYIFPGGMLPCERELSKLIQAASSIQPTFTRFGLDYAETLRRWTQAFVAQKIAVDQLGYSAEFQRMWMFYLGYCEGAFRAGQINVVTMSYQIKK